MTNPIKEMKDSNGYEVKFSLRNCPCILKDHNYSNVLCYPIKLPSQLNLANDHVHVHCNILVHQCVRNRIYWVIFFIFDTYTYMHYTDFCLNECRKKTNNNNFIPISKIPNHMIQKYHFYLVKNRNKWKIIWLAFIP